MVQYPFCNNICFRTEIHQIAEDITLHIHTLSGNQINTDLKSVENPAAQRKVTFNAEQTYFMKVSFKQSQQYPLIVLEK